MKCWNVKLSGVYTIEMSLIMPIVVGILWLMISWGIYMYDSSLIEYVIVRATHNSDMNISQYSYNPDNLFCYVDFDYDMTNEYIQSELAMNLDDSLDKTIGNWTMGKAYDVRDNKINICVNGYMNTGVSDYWTGITNEIWKYNTSYTSNIMNEWEYIITVYSGSW